MQRPSQRLGRLRHTALLAKRFGGFFALVREDSMMTRRDWLALAFAGASGHLLMAAQKTAMVTLVIDGMT